MPKSLHGLTLSFSLVLAVLFTLVSSLPASAIPIQLKADVYSVPEGLSQSTVTSIAEDPDGYIWVGTVNGLNRFDGRSFKQFFSNDGSGLKSSFIRSLIYSRKYQALIVGTDSGLSKYDPETERFIGVNFSESVLSIDESDDKLFITTPQNTYVFNEIEKSPIHKSSTSVKNIKSGILIKNSEYILTYSGELLHNNKTISLNIENIEKISDSLYAAKKDEIIEFIDGNRVNSIPGTYDSLGGDSEHLYYTYGNSIFKLNKDNSSSYIGRVSSKKYSLKSPYIKKVKNGILLSNINEGFVYLKSSKNLLKKLDITNKPTWSLSLDSSDHVVIADQSDKIRILNSDLVKGEGFDSKFTGPKSVLSDNNRFLIGNSEGLFQLSKDTMSIRKVMATPVSVVKRIKNQFLIGTVDGQIISLDTENLTKIESFTVDTQFPVFDMISYNNELYIATQGGLYKKDSSGINNIYSHDMVFCLSANKNSVYFGTPKNILRYDGENTSLFYSNNKSIFSIVATDELIATSSIKEVVVFKDNQEFVINSSYGAQLEYNSQSGIIINNKLLFGGNSGVSILDISELSEYINSQERIIPTIDSLLIFNIEESVGDGVLDKSIQHTEKVVLKHSDYPFTLKFSAPSSDIDNIEFMYSMEGLSDDWISSKGTNSATYTNLSPGTYNFHVYAINPLTQQQGITRTLQIEITPPWWLSTLAKTLYVLAILLILTAITKAVLRKREIQRQIALSEERLKLSLWGSGDEMWDWDIETGQIYRSNIWGSLEFPRDGQRSGHHGEESNIHPQDRERVREALNKHFYGETDHFEATYRVKSKSGEWLWILDRAKIVERDEHDNALRMTGTIKNINSFKTAEEQLRLFERAIENISEGMFILDADFHYVEVNEACCELTQHSRNQLLGTTLQFSRYPDNYNQQIKQLLQQYGRWSNDIEAIKGDGSEFLMELTIDAIYDEQGILTHYVGVFSDISRRKQQEEELRKLTNNDLLTGLPNRSNLQVTLGNLVKKDHHHTLMVLDLDNFKKINDSLGHQIGDELLILVAERLQQSIPGHTNLYRLGGDEFAILVDKNPDIGSSAVIASRVIDAFGQAFELVGEQLVVGVSIGIVLYPEDEQNEQALLRKADIAMYHAKSAGGNRYQFYSESLNRNAIRQLEVENLIREGLKDDLFEVYYQPKINLRSGLVSGMEALVRLNHPQHGLIPPNDFIPLAEENGLIVEIGDLVMRKACFAAQQWREQGLFDGRVAVNLSSRQFALPDLQQRIASILRLTRLPPANLELEITEGTVIKHPEKAIKVMQQLAKMGVCLALDDFGTGYSSLSYLKRFPIHCLKIDKAFVDDIDKSDRDLKMVDSIITIAHNMGLSVVGEGVEDSSQLSILKALNCEEIQGFIYSKAVPEAEFSEYLKQNLPTFTGKKNTI
ncbi:EAL domain-containing protein [Shewanella algae]|uniref:EAL domain-containing protein n=1 Tax=Shewanella algae TaxID=38313 RepID=UPI001AAE452C|nr:EAL domain-containing protein [Shewanella algae]MBO2594920.1 EAL domain-containing protein [Shewanella algae]